MTMKGIEKRMGVMQAIAGIIFVVLLSRLAYMQLIEQEKYTLMAQSNRIQLATVTAARGEIMDRNGKVLARSRPSFNISVALVDLKKEDQEEVFRRLASLLGRKAEDIENLVKQQPKKYVPV
ncbi:MAG: penicillin-binding protein 2, partial [Bacillota bacterium]